MVGRQGFFIHVSNVWICVISCVHTASQMSSLAKILFWTLHANSSTKLWHTYNVYRNHWLVVLYTTLTVAVSHNDGMKQKPAGFIFSHTSQLNRMKVEVVLMQVKLNILILLLSEICWNKGNNDCFTVYVRKLTLACIWMFMNRFCPDLLWW